MRFWGRNLQSEPAPEAEPPMAAVSPAPPVEPVTAEEPERRGWFARLRQGMARSSARLSDGIGAIFTRRRLDDAALSELEELLITSDMGVGVAAEVTAA